MPERDDWLPVGEEVCAVCEERGTISDPLVDWKEGLAHEMCGYDNGWEQA